MRRTPLPVATALIALLLGTAGAVIPGTGAQAATVTVSTAEELADAVAQIQGSGVIQLANSITTTTALTATAEIEIAVPAGATLTVPDLSLTQLWKTGAGALTILRDASATIINVRFGSLNVGRDLAAPYFAVYDGASATVLGSVHVPGVLGTGAQSILTADSITVADLNMRGGTVVTGELLVQTEAGISGTLRVDRSARFFAGSMVTHDGTIELHGRLQSNGVIRTSGTWSGSGHIVNAGLITGSSIDQIAGRTSGENYLVRLSDSETGFQTEVRVFAATLSDGGAVLDIPGSAPNGRLFREWTVAGVALTGSTYLITSRGSVSPCTIGPETDCGRTIDAAAAWDSLAFSTAPQVGVATTLTTTSGGTRILAFDTDAALPGTTVTPTPADAGRTLRGTVTVAYPSGYAATTGSASVSAVVAEGLFSEPVVRIDGDARAGERVTAVADPSITPAPDAVSFEWSTPLGVLGRGATLVIPASAVGQPLTVTLVATGTGYAPRTVSSAPVVVTAAPARPAGGRGVIAATGVEPTVPAILGVLLLAVGAVSLAAGRPRRLDPEGRR